MYSLCFSRFTNYVFFDKFSNKVNYIAIRCFLTFFPLTLDSLSSITLPNSEFLTLAKSYSVKTNPYGTFSSAKYPSLSSNVASIR
jgi:hypothetical protein